MLGATFKNVKLSGMACALPGKKMNTDDYIDYYGKESVEQFKKTTGIESRYISNGKQTSSDLCYVAARELMKKKGYTGEDIDALVYMTQTPDYKVPSTAFLLHKRLNIKKECIVFDVNIGCSAFVNGLHLLAGMIQGGAINRALLLIGDAELEHPVTDNRSFSMMFADAGSACLIEKGEGEVRSVVMADGEGYNTLITPYPGARFPKEFQFEDGLQKKMDGDDVFLFTITQVPKLFKAFFKEYNYSWDDFDYCMLHQANLMILNNVAKRIKLPAEKMPISLAKYGNTDGSSIPVGIVDLCEGIAGSRKLRLIASGYGIGLSWGIAAFEIDTADVLPMIITDEYYEEGFKLE